MKLEKFKERDNKRIGIIVFTIVCVLLVSGVILYRTFAIFEVKTNQNIINGQVQGMGDLEFAFYVDDKLVKDINEIPKENSNYSLDTSSSYCMDLLNDEQVSNVNWNDEKWSIELKNITTTKTKCYLHFKKIYKDSILNGADPDLMNGRLVPVKILDNEKPTDVNYEGAGGGKVVKADITTEWYNYGSKNWANAVILRDGKVDDYKPNEEIKESDIESYFVWIPRYKYKLKNSEEEFNKYETVTAEGLQTDIASFYKAIGGNKGETEAFDIQFETKDKGNTQSGKQGDYITHPAFISFDSNGFWVGKFETSKSGSAEDNSVSPESVQIKPNVYSWRNIQVANAFYTSYNYQRDLESHMMKNMEWGAVAYLTQSKYGRCGENENCTEVRINNSQNYITGMSAASAPTCGFTGSKENCNWYETTDLTKDGERIKSYYNRGNNEASTTGNYSGIYDMVGGAWAYIMGVMQYSKDVATPTTGPNLSNNSGFNGPYSTIEDKKEDGQPWSSSKYYDLYDYDNSDQHYYRGKLGDGTKEFGPFYSAAYSKSSTSTEITRQVGSYNGGDAFFVSQGYPWFIRGGMFSLGTETGVEAFGNTNGGASDNTSFRVVLTP